jgi:hypothetical protein
MFAKINQKILSVVSLVISTSVLSIALSSAFVVVSQKTAQAGDLSWSGLYRIEYFQSENLELDGVKRRDGYFLHHLVMSPKFTAADGLTIYSRFDLLNNCQFGQNGQAGQLLGDGISNSPNCSTATPTPAAGKSNVFSSSQNPESLLVNQLYLTWVQEFGALIVGRAPLQFGLGLTYNAGNGPFDHWFTNEDMVGYKFVFGNLFVLPMLGKVQQGSSTGANNLDIGGSINDYMIQVQYENPETDLALGVFALPQGRMPSADLPQFEKTVLKIKALTSSQSKKPMISQLAPKPVFKLEQLEQQSVGPAVMSQSTLMESRQSLAMLRSPVVGLIC